MIMMQAIAVGDLLLKAKGADGQPKYFIRCDKVKPRVLEVSELIDIDRSIT